MDEAYRPDRETFCEILKAYALDGVQTYRSDRRALQTMLPQAFQNHVTTDVTELDRFFAQVRSSRPADLGLIPAPRPHADELAGVFFHPRINPSQSNGTFSFSLVVLFVTRDADRHKCFAIRLEPSETQGSAHDYVHMQLTREIRIRQTKLPTDLAPWMPTSYPAFPLASRHPIHVFFAMVMAIHGYTPLKGDADEERFAKITLRNVLRKANRVDRLPLLIKEIDRHYCPVEPAAA